MKTTEIFETVNDQLTGYLNIPGLAQILPDINNVADFDEALDKLRLGQGAYLTVPEKMQLALAFISLVGLDAQHKTLVMRMLSGITARPTPTESPQQNSATSTQIATNTA